MRILGSETWRFQDVVLAFWNFRLLYLIITLGSLKSRSSSDTEAVVKVVAAIYTRGLLKLEDQRFLPTKNQIKQDLDDRKTYY